MHNTVLVSDHVSNLNAIINKPNLSAAIVNHLGGIAAFEMAADMLDLGINIDKINGFKNDADTVEFFKEHKAVILATLATIADDMNLLVIDHLFNLCHTHRYSYEVVTQCHDILFYDDIAAKADKYQMLSADAAAHQIVLNVVTVILEAYTKHKNKWY